VDLDVTSLHHRRAVHRWERMSVGDLIERVTWSRPDKLAIVGRPGAYADERLAALTYRQADETANRVAHALLASELERGDVVLLFCENSVEAYLAKIGIAKAGLVAAPLNPMMAPDLVAAMIDLVQPKLAIVDAELWPKAQEPFASKGLRAAVTIAIGGPTAVMAGYYRDEAATRHAFRYGWFHSGDSCAYDDAGLRIMLDRYKDIVKTGGENVSSLRVEAVLAQHPDVAKAAVIGLPHPRWSEAVTAVVVLRDGAEAGEDELIKHCRASLAGYETPKSVVFAADLPETVGGKVLKYKLRAEHAGHYRDVDP
jgi:acyl-CoA synthetase (AMP-forming)/AMP-acid ligase II